MRKMARFVLLIFTLSVAFPGFALNRFEALRWVDNQLPESIVLRHKELVAQIYATSGNQLIWYNEDAVLSFEQSLEVVAIADLSDLFFKRLVRLKEARAAHRAMEYDIIATDTLLSYISYTELSQENGKAWYFGDRIPTFLPEPSERARVLLMRAIEAARLNSYIRQALTVSKEQKVLNLMLEELLNQDLTYARYVQNGGLKRPGDRLENKAALVERLAIVGVDTSSIDLDTNTFDVETEHAVLQFQKLHGLKQDGVIGENTLKWLNTSIEERARILALNSERLRLWNLKRDDTMIINVPDFRLRYWNNGETSFDTKVIVGRRSRKTPLINTNMNAVILNPTWNVPRQIVVKDIIPAIKRDETYIEKHQYEILADWVSEQTVDPNELNWQAVVPERFPYRFRQNSGPGNALGLYKFNTPNRKAIYLHDTPSKYLFENETRAFSSGCIRVQNADKLANLLFNSRTSERMRKKIAERDRTAESNYVISLNKIIPVHIIYQTAWIESGLVQYRNDIYHYDHHNKSETFDQKITKLSSLDKLLSKQ
jgi:murein L,D-transpeptidase YcbB/YkuD